MQSSEDVIGRFEAFEGRMDVPELLDAEGRVVRDLGDAAEIRVTKRGNGRVFTIRLSLEDGHAWLAQHAVAVRTPEPPSAQQPGAA